MPLRVPPLLAVGGRMDVKAAEAGVLVDVDVECVYARPTSANTPKCRPSAYSAPNDPDVVYVESVVLYVSVDGDNVPVGLKILTVVCTVAAVRK